LAALAAEVGFFPGWPKSPKVFKEPKIAGGRLDLRLDSPLETPFWVEVKNCSLGEGDTALFPDAKSERARRHLYSLMELAKKGDRAAILILIQREARVFRPAAAIDPAFAKALKEAALAGVEIMAYRVRLDLEKAALGERVPVIL
jgi:sugar fermentation stimulation protein A